MPLQVLLLLLFLPLCAHGVPAKFACYPLDSYNGRNGSFHQHVVPVFASPSVLSRTTLPLSNFTSLVIFLVAWSSFSYSSLPATPPVCNPPAPLDCSSIVAYVSQFWTDPLTCAQAAWCAHLNLGRFIFLTLTFFLDSFAIKASHACPCAFDTWETNGSQGLYRVG